MKQKFIPLAMAVLLGSASLTVVPQAFAVEDLSVKAINTYMLDKKSDYEIAFTLEKYLDSGDEIVITFDDAFAINSKISKNDVYINGRAANTVKLSKNELTITSGRSYDSDEEIEITIQNAITNPDRVGNYDVRVKTENESSARARVKIDSNKADSSFAVKLSDKSAGGRSSYSFEAYLGDKELVPLGEVTIEFPSAEMIPAILSANQFSINGQAALKVSATGNKVFLTAPGSVAKSNTVKVDISEGAWILNPKEAGSYKLKMTVDGRSITSDSYEISAATANQPVQTPGLVDNSTAIISLGTTEPGQATGLTVSIRGVGVPLAKQQDFIELVFPKEFRVPAFIATSHVTVNGAAADYVAVRGQNVLIYPAQDIHPSTATNVVIGAGANIVTPTEKKAYSISVYTSEEKGLLFARAVGIGTPAPAQPPVPVPTAPTAPGTPAPSTPAAQPVDVPADAVLFQLNTASYTKNGQTSALQVAPYLADGSTTMVPAQFFADALNLTTLWDTKNVSIISGTKVLQFTVGSNKVKIGDQEHTLTSAVALKDGMPMVPIRFVTDNLGYKVGWDTKTSSVYVYR